MTFMMIVTLSSLVIIVRNQIIMIMNGTTDWGPYAQAGIGILLIGLALELAVEGYRTIIHQRKQAKLEKQQNCLPDWMKWKINGRNQSSGLGSPLLFYVEDERT